MKPTRTRYVAAAMACVAGAPPLQPAGWTPEVARGDWVGELRLPSESGGDRTQLIRLRFASDSAGGTHAFADLPAGRRWNVRVAVRAVADAWLGFSIPMGGDTAHFDGSVTPDSIGGPVRSRHGAGTLVLIRRAAYDSAAMRPLAGNYRITRGRVISMGPLDEAGGWLQFFDAGTRRGGILFARSDSVLFSGPAFGVDYPAAIRVTVERDERGKVRRLRWQEEAGPPRIATRLDDVRQERVSFTSGGARLVGTVTLPATRGPHPAVVLIHGCCGSVPTRDFGYWSWYLAHHGIAVLAFDRRGGGESGGDFHSATYDQLAGDVLAGVELLRTRPEIAGNRVGLYGMSNGGYVAPLAAARSGGRVAFVAVRAGSARPVGGNIDFEVENDLRAQGFDDADVRRGVALRQAVTRFVVERPVITPAAWDSLTSQVKAVQGMPWFTWTRTMWVPRVSPADSGARAWLNSLRESWKYDPMPYWRQLSVPIYIMLGGLDRSVPTEESARTFREAFARSGNRRATVRVFPNADHGLLVARDAHGRELGARARYVEGFQADLIRWIRRQTAHR